MMDIDLEDILRKYKIKNEIGKNWNAESLYQKIKEEVKSAVNNDANYYNQFSCARPYIYSFIENIIVSKDEDYSEEVKWIINSDGHENIWYVFISYIDYDEKDSEDNRIIWLRKFLHDSDCKKKLCKNLIDYYTKINHSFSDYEYCIKYLCQYYRIFGDIYHLDDEFVNCLGHSIFYSGDKSDWGYAYGGLAQVKEHLKYITDSNIIIKLLNYFESFSIWQDKIKVKQVLSIIQNCDSRPYQKEYLKFFYIDRRYLENEISRLIRRKIEGRYNDYIYIDNEKNKPLNSGIMSFEKTIITRMNKEETEKIEFIIRYELFSNIKFIIKVNKQEVCISTIKLEKNDIYNIIIEFEKSEDISIGFNESYYSDTNIDEVEEHLAKVKANIEIIFTEPEAKKVGLEILYLWIQKYKSFKDVNFNFSNQYRFHYKNGDGRISIDRFGKNTNMNLFVIGNKLIANKIKNVNIVVGKNGAGKTTLINYLKDEMNLEQEREDNNKFIIIYKMEEEIYCANNIKSLILNKEITGITEIKTSNNEIKIYNKEKPDFLNYTSVIYFSNILSMNKRIHKNEEIKKASNFIDISSQKIFESEILNFSNHSYYNNDIIRQIIFLLEYGDHYSTKNTIPSEFIIDIQHIDIKNIKNMINSELKDETDNVIQDIINILENIVDILENIMDEEVRNILIYSCFDKIIQNYKNDKYMQYININIKVLYDNYSDVDKLSEFFNEIGGNQIIELYKICLKIEKNNTDNKKESKYKISFEKNENEIREFIKIYNNVEFKLNLFKFELSEISSGETAKLITYSRFYWLISNKKFYVEFNIRDNIIYNEFKLNENLIILIDEADILLHPEMQRKYLHDLICFFQQIFSENEDVKNVQIILTSNSPFLISDLPNNNIIFLVNKENNCIVDDKKNNKTLGANIHALLKDSFFMESTIGEFAKIQINEVVQFLSKKSYEGSMNKEKAKFIIENIGEDLIRNKLLNMYEEKHFEELEDINKRVEYYKNKIMEMEKIMQNPIIIDNEELVKLQSNLKNILQNVTNIVEKSGEKND